jgi:uncharacterized protein YndB with AHSA1/START domain
MTTSASRVIGSIRAENGRGTVRMEEVYDTPPADLWSAVTEPDRLARWVAEVTGDLQPGGDFHARFTSGWDGPGRVDICDPPRRLLATMSPGSDDESVIEATLADEGGRTRLVIEERGIPLAEIADHGAGWQAHVEDLAAHLVGRDADDWRERWVELVPAYSESAADLLKKSQNDN